MSYMPNLQQAKKAMRQAVTKRVVNDKRRRAMREAVKIVRTNVITSTVTPDQLSTAFKALDKAAKRGVIKQGTADRKKSRLAKSVATVTK